MALPGPGSPARWSGTARVVHGADVVEEVSAGSADGPDGQVCSPELRHQAGSISKLVVSVVALALAERGAVALDQPVGRWLGGTPRAWEAVTLHQLLSHTSGLGHWGDLADLPGTFLTTPPAREELVALTLRSPLVDVPGRTWSYSGPGYLVAALVVEAATGAPYGDVATELVLRPAGLRATTSGVHPAAGDDGVARGHHRGERVPLAAGFTALPGTGDLWTTVGDLVTLGQALRTGVVLAEDVAARLWTPYARTAGAGDDGPVAHEAYGYGTFLGRVAGRRARIHPGDNLGYQSLLAHLPDDDLDVAVLCNEDAPSVAAALARLTSL